MSVDDAETTSRSSTAAGPMRLLKAFSGAVAAGFLVLAAVVAASAVLAGDRPGPGAGVVAGHVLVAAVAVALQIYSQRRRGALGFIGAVAVLALTGAALWYWWWI
jgi:hypothetical protein